MNRNNVIEYNITICYRNIMKLNVHFVIEWNSNICKRIE